MGTEYFVYCDESCHLEFDHIPIMVLGAIWCPREKVKSSAVRIREIKQKHCLPTDFEIKWSKVSPSKKDFYLDLVDYFFDNEDLHFRALVVADKANLDHEQYSQDHDTWYYKMYFNMLKTIFSPIGTYRIFLDIKDTHGNQKVIKLHEYLCNNIHDSRQRVVKDLQIVRSNEIEQLQLTDLLIGAVSYANRNLDSNSAKIAVVERIVQRSGYSLKRTTLYREDKVNLFIWSCSAEQDD